MTNIFDSIKTSLPFLLFNEDAVLCDERGILNRGAPSDGIRGLEHEFLLSLGRELKIFKAFCAKKYASDNTDYKIFKLSFRDYLYAFCEKDVLLGGCFNMVFLSRNVCDFYSFMSPASVYYRSVSDKLIYELLCLGSDDGVRISRLTPEATLAFSKIPHLAREIFDNCCHPRYCDILKITEQAVTLLRCKQPGDATDVSITAKYSVTPDTPHNEIVDKSAAIIEMPPNAYVSVLLLIINILTAASSDHRITITVHFFGNAAEVELSTISDRMCVEVRGGSLNFIGENVKSIANCVKLASVISYIAGINAVASYANTTSLLKVTLGIGLDVKPTPDYKFSDPYENVPYVIDETLDIIGSL